MASVISKLKDLLARKREQQATSYETLVRQIADGKEPALEILEAALEGAGKTPEDLARDVAQLERRRDLTRQLAEAKKAQAEGKKLEAEIKAKGLERDNLISEFNRKHLEPLFSRLQDLGPLISQVAKLEADLRKMGSPVDDDLMAVGQEILASQSRLESLRESCFKLEQGTLADYRERLRRATTSEAENREQAELDRYSQALKERQTSLKEAETQHQELLARRKQLEESVLVG